MNLMDRVLHAGEGKIIRRLNRIVGQVNSIEEDYVAMSDDELAGQTADFRQRLDNGENLDRLLPEAFATVREASRRVLGKRHFDVQIMGGAALYQCNIAEMKTGEGKTLVGLLPAYLEGLLGKGVHVVTVNDYLARVQSEQMGRVHHFLGLTISAILSDMPPMERKEAYKTDITYGTNNEFGFDYLRDNMASSLSECVQRGHHFAIVDEVDSILVDEARTPLIISGPAEENKQWYPEFAKIVSRLQRDVDYEVDEKKRTVAVLGHGISVVEERLGIQNLYESANTPLIGYLNNAIKAKELFHRDKDYVIIDGEVLIVDEHTGRTLAGRRYNEGLHQALEAKEHVEIKDEYQTLATITLQNYFRMYDKLAGMTGTAKTEESEFQKIYGLGVIPIPTNRPMIRKDQKDLIYRTEDAKFDAIISDVVERHEAGQPILIGTASVAKSELLSEKLKRAGVPHKVLNAKHHESEAAIVALAGRKGAVTVSTNMAGRGTDIILGGNPEFLTELDLREKGLDPVEDEEAYQTAWNNTLSKWVSRQIESAQKQVEAQNFEMRKNVLKYDDVMNRQRHVIYGDRRKVLEGADVEVELRATTDRVVEAGVRKYTQGYSEDWDLEAMWDEVGTVYPVGLDINEYADCQDGEELVEDFKADAQDAYDRREAELGEATMRQLEREVLLTVLDRKWREHLYEMDYLREGIGLRAMAQRDPLVEYQREGGDMFNSMMDSFKEEVVGFLFNLEIETSPQVGLVTDAEGQPVTADSVLPQESRARRALSYSAPDEQGDAKTTAEGGAPKNPKAEGNRAARRSASKKSRKNRKKR